MNSITDFLAAIEAREKLTHEPCDDDVGCPQCTHAMHNEFPAEKVGICHDCSYELNDHVAPLLALVRKYRDALEQIAKPAPGGKQQQWTAQEVLKYDPR